MKKLLTSAGLFFGAGQLARAVNRFPRPDFESGYQYPEYSYAVPNEMLWDIIDVSVLLILLGIVTWALYKKRTRGPILAVSVVSVGYFGFFRGGCVCSIGSIQNIALAFVDPSYSLPI
ncbi:MAG: 4Fe-4S ferredoxin, partial [Bacteroidales bacterium]|nr:4Fe-4S ferredoxin [Bacteroidales bacterium]